MAIFRLLRKRKIIFDRLIIFSLGWFIVSLLPVLGLGNIAERYLYIPSFGFTLLMASFIYSFYRRILLGRTGQFKTMLKFGVLVVTVFAIIAFYYQETERAKKSWRETGEISNKILRTLSTTYSGFPEGSTLYFINLPLRIERAWVFPVGIEDGLWFVYRDETMKVMKGNDLNQALDYKEKNKSIFVFIYENGELREAIRL
jgi:hypothetical protein